MLTRSDGTRFRVTRSDVTRPDLTWPDLTLSDLTRPDQPPAPNHLHPPHSDTTEVAPGFNWHIEPSVTSEKSVICQETGGFALGNRVGPPVLGHDTYDGEGPANAVRSRTADPAAATVTT